MSLHYESTFLKDVLDRTEVRPYVAPSILLSDCLRWHLTVELEYSSSLENLKPL